jgi:chemotaxis protein methyltransferase CheR
MSRSGAGMLADEDLCVLLTNRIGLRLEQDFHLRYIERFIASRTLALGLSSAQAYVTLLAQQSLESTEFSLLISTLANTNTHFFRDRYQFLALRLLLDSVKDSQSHPVFIWSAGCATGEEPYSVAMLCEDLNIEAHILATDISQEALEFARRACYQSWSLRHLPAEYRDRFFTRSGESYELCAAIRDRVSLRFHNLVEKELRPVQSDGSGWNLILCRNVMIYFDRSTIERVALNLARVLAPDGWIFLSTTENLQGYQTPLLLCPIGDSFGYRLRAQGALLAASPPAFDDSQNRTTVSHSSPSQSVRACVEREEKKVAAAQGLYQEALQHLEQGNTQDAQIKLKEVIAADPNHFIAQVTLGNIFLRRHDFEAALAVYEKVQACAPLMPEVHYFQGVIFLKLADLERAVHAFRHTLFLQPSFWCASFLLAGVYRRLDRTDYQRRNLELTLSLLEQSQPHELFFSYINGMKDVDLDPIEVIALCKRYLART